MKEKLAVLIMMLRVFVARAALKNTDYCVATKTAIQVANSEAEYLLRYAEVSGNLGYRTHARRKVRNSAQRMLDALRLPPAPSLKSREGGGRGAERNELTEADIEAVKGDWNRTGEDLFTALTTKREA